MLSRYRSACGVSTIGVGPLAVLALASCVDPASRFDEFVARVPDARAFAEGCPAISGPMLTPLPNLSGTSLFALKLAFAPPPIRLQVTHVMTVTGNAGTMDVTLKFLKVPDGTITGEPIVVRDIPIAATGQYCYTIPVLAMPADANPLGTGDARAKDVIVAGNIKSADFSCGEISGQLEVPVQESLNGSTFGSVRAPDGATGSQLPAPVTGCPKAVDGGQ